MRGAALALLALCVAVAHCLDTKYDENTLSFFEALIRPDAEHCQKKLGVSKEDVKLLNKLEFESFTDGAKCLAACVLERLGFMENGKFVPFEKNAKDFEMLDLEEEMVKKCGITAHEKFAGDRCNIAYHAMYCALSNSTPNI